MIPVDTVAASYQESFQATENFVGIIEAKRRSQLAFELSGTLTEINFDEGEEVTQGALLANLDKSRLEASLQEVQASLAENTAALVFARSVLSRDEELVRSRAVSEEVLEDSRQKVDLAEAREARLLAQIQSVKVDLAKSDLHVPYNATISKRFIDQGAIVSPNSPVFEILETGKFEARVAVSPSAAERVLQSKESTIVLPNGKETQIPLSRALPQTNRGTRTRELLFELPQENNSLRDGDLVTLTTVKTISQSGFFLPRTSLTEGERGLWACFSLVPSKEKQGHYTLDRRDLKVLHYEGEQVFVTGSVREGERILKSGLSKFANGQLVTLK